MLVLLTVGVIAAVLFVILVALIIRRNDEGAQSYTTGLQRDFVDACKTGVHENVCRCAIGKIVDEVPFDEFKAFADQRKAHPEAESPSWLTERVEACQEEQAESVSS
jgi:hypothetical protein